MKRVVKINNTYGTEDKYVLYKEYEGFGIYEEVSPSGWRIHQSWLISNNNGNEIAVDTYNGICYEELLDMIDNFNTTGKFGVKAVMHCGSLHMHNSGKEV